MADERASVCSGCGAEIDPDTCGCGGSREFHGSAMTEGARAEIERLRTDRGSMMGLVEHLTAEVGALRAEIARLTEVVGYWERGNVPRLLGIAPDQLATVRGVLRGLAAFMDQSPGMEWDAITRAWDAAGRPLGDAGEEVSGG